MVEADFENIKENKEKRESEGTEGIEQRIERRGRGTEKEGDRKKEGGEKGALKRRKKEKRRRRVPGREWRRRKN